MPALVSNLFPLRGAIGVLLAVPVVWIIGDARQPMSLALGTGITLPAHTRGPARP